MIGFEYLSYDGFILKKNLHDKSCKKLTFYIN